MQNKVNDLIKKYNLNTDVSTRYIDLVSEIGELGKEIIKGSDYNTKDFEVTKDTKEEIGDCLFSLLALCSNLNLDYKQCLDIALNKYQKRFLEKQNISSK